MDQVKDMSGISPNIGAAYEITVFDRNGNVRQVINEDAKCFVRNFMRMIKNLFYNGTPAYPPHYGSPADSRTPTNFRNLAGAIVSTRGIDPTGTSIGAFIATALAGDLTKGIVVGSGSTAVIDDDYKLGTIITHGSGAGQLVYDAESFLPLATVGNTVTITTARMVGNSSANPVVIYEIGLYLMGLITIMLLRDVISPSVTLNAGESALIAYKIIING